MDNEFVAFLHTLKGRIETTTELDACDLSEVTEEVWKQALWTDKKVSEILLLIEDKIRR